MRVQEADSVAGTVPSAAREDSSRGSLPGLVSEQVASRRREARACQGNPSRPREPGRCRRKRRNNRATTSRAKGSPDLVAGVWPRSQSQPEWPSPAIRPASDRLASLARPVLYASGTLASLAPPVLSASGRLASLASPALPASGGSASLPPSRPLLLPPAPLLPPPPRLPPAPPETTPPAGPASPAPPRPLAPPAPPAPPVPPLPPVPPALASRLSLGAQASGSGTMHAPAPAGAIRRKGESSAVPARSVTAPAHALFLIR